MLRICISSLHPALSASDGENDKSVYRDEAKEIVQQAEEDRMIKLLKASGSSDRYLLLLNRCIRLISSHTIEAKNGQPFIFNLGETFWHMIDNSQGVRLVFSSLSIFLAQTRIC